MPKRKKSRDVEHIGRKIRKLEQKLQRAKRRINDRHDSSSFEDDPEVIELLDNQSNVAPIPGVSHATSDEHPVAEEADPPSCSTLPDLPNTDNTEIDTPEVAGPGPALDPDILEILGVDPGQQVSYGNDIHEGLASRLEHMATSGLSKESRRELNDKYLIPANCVKIGAPSMNPEIKAAIPEIVMKRDKALEARQKQLASAISGLASLISDEIQSKEKNNTRLKQLMDVSKTLCDIQHSESVTRRNFAIASIKKDLKEHIANTKIDKCLFGENLADTLKTAKAVTKSGTELRQKVIQKPKPLPYPSSNLNFKGPAPARKQTGPQRSREPAQPRAPAPGPQARSFRNATRTDSSRPSQYQSKQTHRH